MHTLFGLPTRGVRTAFLILSALVIVTHLPIEAHANVYATNIRLNGSATNAAVATGNSINITYVLNEPATLGVTINIKSGNTPVRTINITNGSPGTVRGTNIVAWNTRDDGNNLVALGTYSVTIAARSAGYPGWSQTTFDTDPGTSVYEPVGIAVNRNTNSIYYGRVFVANASEGPNPDPVDSPGDVVGMQKLNADSGYALEGAYSSGGWTWAGDDFSPWKIEVSDDDRVYINDFTLSGGGKVLSFDQTLSSGSRLQVLRSDNYPNGAVRLSGPAITGSGANTQVWMADTTAPGGVGIQRWNATGSGLIATNDTGTNIVQAGGGSDLGTAPYDVAVDPSNRIYTIQNTTTASDPAYRVLRFPAFTGAAEQTADWKIGSTDDGMRGASGVAVDPTATYVAVSFTGAGFGIGRTGGGVRVFYATNGADVITLTPATFHDHNDVAWDNVGNLYTLDNFDGRWRAYSPPGTNQATTVGLVTIQVTTPPVAPTLSAPGYSGGKFRFTLNGEANVSYIILSSTNLQGWGPVLTNVSTSATRQITNNSVANRTFYRALVGP